MSDEPFDFNKWFAEASEQLVMNGNVYLNSDGEVVKPENLTIVKSSAYIPMSIEHLIDAGAMTEEEARARGWTPTVYPPVPRRVRLRLWVMAWRMKLGVVIGSWIAGVRLDDEYDDE